MFRQKKTRTISPGFGFQIHRDSQWTQWTYKAYHTQKDIIHDIHLAFLLDFSHGIFGAGFPQGFGATNSITNPKSDLPQSLVMKMMKMRLKNVIWKIISLITVSHPKWAIHGPCSNYSKLCETSGGKFQGVRKNQLLVLYQTSTVALTAFWGIICVQRKRRWRTSILGYLDLSRR